MEINKICCDRCGKELKFSGWNKWIRGNIRDNHIAFNPKGKRMFDFCDKCMNELCRWVEKGENNGRTKTSN